nr:MAG TPA: hypothetical protein [Caudoviricetes sp.]
MKRFEAHYITEIWFRQYPYSRITCGEPVNLWVAPN